MKHPQFKQYAFTDSAHWQSGVYKNLYVSETIGLISPPGFDVHAVAGTNSDDQTPALDMGPCDQLHWVRTSSGELICLYSAGLSTLGRLSDAGSIKKLIVGINRLWLLTRDSINSYTLNELQPLRQISFSHITLDIAGDGGDGIWVLQQSKGQPAALQHFDQYGQSGTEIITLSESLKRAALAVSSCGKKIVVLDYGVEKTNSCKTHKPSWRVFIIDCVSKRIEKFDGLSSGDETFNPRLLCIDNKNLVYLLDPQMAIIQTINLDGALLAQQRVDLAESSLPIAAMTAGSHISLSTATGIVDLKPSTVMMSQDENYHSTFITPALMSPSAVEKGWQRAQFEVELPAGTTLEVSYAASDDQDLKNKAEAVLQNRMLSPANKLNRLNQLLSWNNDDSLTYVGEDAEAQYVNYSFPLHKIEQTYLWLRFKFYTQVGNKPPALKSLFVSYPNRTYLNYLPAVYQHNPESAAKMKSFLAIFESLFDHLDATIDNLPRHIDPDTAPDSWLGFLLRWLGLPTSKQMSIKTQRELLINASALLAQRGTIAALRQLLQILGGEDSEFNIRVEDLAAGPSPWVLQPQNRATLSARLGCDTLILAQTPPSFRLGETSLGVDKGVPLGKGQADPQMLFNQRSGVIIIQITIDNESRQKLEPIINKLLPYFIPAHCRYRVEFTATASQAWQQRLDVDLHLGNGQGARLGSETIAGRFWLPAVSADEFILDHNARLGSNRLLN